jgi:hypothetical protein
MKTYEGGEAKKMKKLPALLYITDRCSTIRLVIARVSSIQVTCPEEVI